MVERQPDTELELLKDIYTPDVPSGTEEDHESFDHITKDMTLSCLSKGDITFVLKLEGLIELLKHMNLSNNTRNAKQLLATFLSVNRSKDGFERKQQTTSVNIHKITSSGGGIKDQVKNVVGGKK